MYLSRSLHSLGRRKMRVAHELIDEFRLWIFPVVVGHGKRLFGQDTVPTGLTLAKTKTTSNGVMMSIYRRVSKTEAEET